MEQRPTPKHREGEMTEKPARAGGSVNGPEIKEVKYGPTRMERDAGTLPQGPHQLDEWAVSARQ